jgi:hypothetical protein
MRRPIPILVLCAAALPALAQDDPPGPIERLAEELANGMLRQMWGDMAPTLRELQRLMGEVEHYDPPVLLPNGDILIPRKPGAPPPGAPDGPAPAPRGTPPEGAIDL